MNKGWFKLDYIPWNKGRSIYGLNLTEKERKKLINKQYYKTHKKQILKHNRIYNKNHPEAKRKSIIKWQQKYPEKVLKIQKRIIEKQAKEYNLNYFQYRMALLSWSKSVKKRDSYICIKCGSKGEHADHILPKAKYPELALDISNGRTLCVPCHYSRHGFKI